MRGCASLLFAAGLFAQDTAPTGFVRGTLLEWDSFGRTGELSLRTSDNHVYRFSFDTRTYFEGDRKRIWISDLKKGDVIEVLSDNSASPGKRYARTVNLIPAEPSVRFPKYRTRYRTPAASLLNDELFPRGNLTFAGIVSQVNEEMLVLRLYPQGEKNILLRDDTRYIHDGAQVAPSALKVNTRIFLRAGENLYGEIEAYQVMWGEILKPQ